jgi:IS1 family transposase
MRVDFQKACQVVNLLCEGMGIRACERLTQLNRRTILGILETAGEKFARFLDEKVQDVKAGQVQIDEIYSFVGCKPQTLLDRTDEERGEFFTYLSVDRESKLIINWRTSKRNKENTLAFMRDLKRRVPERFQLTSDAFAGYCRGNGAVQQVFGNDVDYSTETKVFGRTNQMVSRYYNPLRVIAIKRKARIGSPDLSTATTCHAERTNLSVRTFTRRFTRCTIGYSKKLENLQHAVAMFVCHFNFCRTHSAHGKTPAQAANLTDHVWKIEEILTATI